MFPSRFVCALLALVLLFAGSPGGAQLGEGAWSVIEAAAPDEPLEVAAGVIITQITHVDQRAENFGAVARIRLRWQDEKLAFDPDETGITIRAMSATDFVAFARENGISIPVYTIENQQTRSFDKTATVTWFPDGTAVALRETILTLQAPDFDFRHFPFDHQSFFLRIVANQPSQFIRFVPLANANGMGDTLGEEEWVVATHWTEVEEVEGVSGLPSSRFSLGFSAHRHLLYYWARIFVPLGLLLGVAWANLFLEEYRRRIDIAGGNLLAFIAFNFTISGELPRLGYLTFLDSLLMAVFIISAGAVAYNVALQRLSIAGHEVGARRFDWHFTFWGFPAIILGAIGLIYVAFFF